MIVSQVVLRNWRNFRAVDVKLEDRVFIVGPNASGKSNFLDVFRFLHDLAKPGGGLQRAVSERGGLSKIRCLAAPQDSEVEVEVYLTDNAEEEPTWKYSIGICQEVKGYYQSLVAHERVWHKNTLLLDRPDKEDKDDEVRLTQTHLEQVNTNAGFREISKFFESVLYLHLVPQLVRYSKAYIEPGLPGDPFGGNFLEHVAKTPEKTRRSRLKKIEAALRLAVPQLKSLTDTRDETGRPHLEVVYEHWQAKGAKEREDQFSDGTLRLIGLLWSLLENDSLLLLEEPELSLNSGIVRRLPPLMYRLQHQRQVVLSTHSADLLSAEGIGSEEILLLTPGPEGTKVELASSISEIRYLLEGGLNIAEAVLPRTEPPAVRQLELFK